MPGAGGGAIPARLDFVLRSYYRAFAPNPEDAMSNRVASLKTLLESQRKANDERLKAQRDAWDQHLAQVTSAEEATVLLKEIAANPLAW